MSMTIDHGVDVEAEAKETSSPPHFPEMWAALDSLERVVQRAEQAFLGSTAEPEGRRDHLRLIQEGDSDA